MFNGLQYQNYFSCAACRRQHAGCVFICNNDQDTSWILTAACCTRKVEWYWRLACCIRSWAALVEPRAERLMAQQIQLSYTSRCRSQGVDLKGREATCCWDPRAKTKKEEPTTVGRSWTLGCDHMHSGMAEALLALKRSSENLQKYRNKGMKQSCLISSVVRVF